MKARLQFAALVAVLALASLALPASAHTDLSLLCADPSPSTAGSIATSSCSVHLHWSLKTDWLRIDLPSTAVMNEDETPANSGEGDDDPDDGQNVGTAVVETNFAIDGCTDPDYDDGDTYNVKWEDTWASYTPPSGWIKVGEFRTVVLLVSIPTHVIKNTTTGQYATVTDLPTTLTCDGTPTNMTINTFARENNGVSSEWIGKNPTSAGNHTVSATATLTDGTTHSDTDQITTT